MTDRRDNLLSDLLREEPVPGRQEAEERAWRVVSAAFDESTPVPRSRPRRRRWAVAAITAALVVGLGALTPAGAQVGDWIGHTFHPGREHARPALASLPGGGRLLVSSRQGPWIVQADGSKRLLGRYGEAGWSPEGLFVVVTQGRELVAVEPGGNPRWSLARPDPIRHPAWSPDGFRIAYLTGGSVRVVAGDGTGDALLASEVARTPPAWSPTAEHVLAYADRDGRVVAVQTDSRRPLWRSAPGAPPRAIAWTPDGRRVLALSGRSLAVYDSHGRRLAAPLPGQGLGDALAIHPGGDSVAVIRHDPFTRRSEVIAVPLSGHRAPQRLFAGDGRFSDVAWSPDGRWLLVAWEDADQWIFIRSTEVRKVVAVSNISRQFDPAGRGDAFPSVSGWCCSPRR